MDQGKRVLQLHVAIYCAQMGCKPVGIRPVKRLYLNLMACVLALRYLRGRDTLNERAKEKVSVDLSVRASIRLIGVA